MEWDLASSKMAATEAIFFNRDEAKDNIDLGLKASFQENKFYFEWKGNVYRSEERE